MRRWRGQVLTFAVHLTSCVGTAPSQAAVPAMIAQRWGCIINISGTAAYNALPDGVHIITSKVALHGLTKATT